VFTSASAVEHQSPPDDTRAVVAQTAHSPDASKGSAMPNGTVWSRDRIPACL